VRGFEVVASVIAAFFFIGIGIGVLLVVALPALRRRRDYIDIDSGDDDRRRYGRPAGHRDNNGPGWQEPPGPDDDQGPPRWPGRRG
jgi:hypothetical protein